MRIVIGADHAGYALKRRLVDRLRAAGHSVLDLGTTSEAPVDYPPICHAVGREVASGRADRGIVLGGSGQGEQIAANKVPGVRAALCNDLRTAELARGHNDANVLAIGARLVEPEVADTLVERFLATPFDGGRHQRRIAQIAALEGLQGPPSGGSHLVPGAALVHGTVEVRWEQGDGRTVDRDRLYVVVSGPATLVRGEDRRVVGAGEVALVPAGVEHRFEDVGAGFGAWVVTWGPVGGAG